MNTKEIVVAMPEHDDPQFDVKVLQTLRVFCNSRRASL